MKSPDAMAAAIPPQVQSRSPQPQNQQLNPQQPSPPIQQQPPSTAIHVPCTTVSTPLNLQITQMQPKVQAPTQLQGTTQPPAPIALSAPTTAGPTALVIIPQHAAATTIAPAKQELSKPYICCLLDNGVRCERVACNASFSARIQKIVGTKKMNFTLDSTARHAYICEHHKAVITVAKKSAPIPRETKSNARNFPANNNTNNNLNEVVVNQANIQHPVNLGLMNQNRIAPNHTNMIQSIQMRPGPHIAYGHYGGHANQIGTIESTPSNNFDISGGDGAVAGGSGIDVDLQQLQVNTLRRYKRHFRVQTRPGLNKTQLAESLKSHFRTLPIIEKEAITYFVYIVKCYRNKLDHNPKAD